MKRIIVVLSLAILAACGGGNDNDIPPVVPPPVVPPPVVPPPVVPPPVVPPPVVPPQDCVSSTKYWTVSGITCSATYPGGTHNSWVVIRDTLVPTVGATTASCKDGSVSLAASNCKNDNYYFDQHDGIYACINPYWVYTEDYITWLDFTPNYLYESWITIGGREGSWTHNIVTPYQIKEYPTYYNPPVNYTYGFLNIEDKYVLAHYSGTSSSLALDSRNTWLCFKTKSYQEALNLITYIRTK